MLCPLWLWTALSATADAKDIDASLTTRPLRAAGPAADLLYEHKASDTLGVYGRTTLGRDLPLPLRLVAARAGAGGDGDQVYVYAAGVGVNRYFRGFDRGWYVGGDMEYAYRTYGLDRAHTDNDPGGRSQTLSAAPHLGYKIVGGRGFTVASDVAVGYRVVFGREGHATRDVDEAPAGSGLGGGLSLRVGWSF
ncbi:MAG: hypothetical protein RL071_4853 [Pseudomonadota bacterium]|jgi:hypothetical protein